ncbi:MAG: hypothetical protein ACREAJ_00975 [Nitrosopumilaceae archaeon]
MIDQRKPRRTPIKETNYSHSQGEFFENGEIILHRVIPYKTSARIGNVFTKKLDNISIDGNLIQKSSKGSLFLFSDKLECNGNKYPFNKIIGISRSGNAANSLLATLETTDKNYQLEIEIKTAKPELLFQKINELMSSKNQTFKASRLQDQKNFLKDRFGLDRF